MHSIWFPDSDPWAIPKIKLFLVNIKILRRWLLFSWGNKNNLSSSSSTWDSPSILHLLVSDQPAYVTLSSASHSVFSFAHSSCSSPVLASLSQLSHESHSWGLCPILHVVYIRFDTVAKDIVLFHKAPLWQDSFGNMRIFLGMKLGDNADSDGDLGGSTWGISHLRSI